MGGSVLRAMLCSTNCLDVQKKGAYSFSFWRVGARVLNRRSTFEEGLYQDQQKSVQRVWALHRGVPQRVHQDKLQAQCARLLSC